ncbi:protein split ends-like isoform X1 [Acanthaster planci]|uniref:Protein split ends-like isoform X1 n=1 Tax=Acanthaster planci TaxID=133434 RepID=A0A8B8A1N5_ACAPL|nr:protein split ends-like isoform X1 [Acanthaster planci]
MLSTLARGCGSWAGDLEVAKDGTVGHRKPVLVSSLAGEDTKFLEKSVNIPLRVKSAVGSAVANTSSTRLVPSADSLVNAIKEKTPKTQYSRPKSVCSSPQRPEAFREKLSRSKSAASIYSKKPKADLATNTSSSSTFAKYGTKFQSVSVQHARSKEALVKALTSSSEVKSHRPDGQIELPKTYMTRKGALMLFTTPENLLFSETDQKCYFKNDQDGKNIGKLSLTLGTVNKLTKSVLQYGSHLQNEDSDSDDNSFREETHMQFIRDEEGSQEVVDYRAQPGADFVFYLRDMQSRSMVRSLARTPSQQSLVSVDSAGELTAALQSIDHRGSPEVRATPEVRGLLSPDVRRLASPSQRLNLSSAGSVRQQSRSALSRPSTSASGRSSSLSAERLAASLKSSPYLGHPIKAPYPSNLVSYQPSQDTCPRHGSARSRQSSLVRQGSAHSTQSRIASSAHSVRSHVSSLGGASQGSKGMLTAEDCGLERPGSENAHSIALSHEGSLIVVNDDVSYHGDSIRSGGLSPQYYQGPEESLFEADFVVSNDVVTDMTSQHNDVTSFNADEDWPQEQQVYSPVHYYGSRPSTASHHTYISGTTSLPTTIQDSQLDPNTLPLEDRLDQDALLVDHDALLLDNPVEEDNTLDMLQESANSGQWPVDSGQERFSPALSARLKSPSSDCPPGSQAKSPSPRPQAVSPVPSGRSSMSQGRGQLETKALLADGYDILPSSTADKDEISSVSKGTSPLPSEKAVTSEPQVEGVLPTEGAVQDQQGSMSVSPSEVVPDHAPSLPAGQAGLADVVNRVRENEMGVPYTTLVPPKLGPTVDKTAKVGGAAVRRSPSPEVKVTPEAKKPPAPSKKISKLDLGSLKSMVKPPAAKSGSPRVGRKSKAKGVRPKATGVQFIDSLNIDSYQGPSEDEVEKMVQEELAKELETSQLDEEGESMPFLVVPEERVDDAASLATDDEALEKELKKQAEPGKMKKSKKSLAKEKAALREARRQEKVRREEELKALERKKKEKEEQKRREKIAEQRRIQVAKEELEDAAQEAERAAQAEEEARQMLLDARRQAREERETRRKAELEKRKLEKEQQRQERRKMEEAARLREQEMAERLASAAEKRRLREEAEWESQEQERLEQEEREREEEEEKRRLEEEEERIRELEREAEEEAIARLVKEREEAERRMRIAREEAERQRQEEERLRLEEEKRKADEEERQKRQEAEAERKRQEELERIKKIQKLEEEARERVQRELARRRAWALRRRELNQAQRDHLNSMRQTQGMTRPWVFSYYVHWPKENYERRMFVAKKKSFRPRPKPKPKPDAEGQGKP